MALGGDAEAFEDGFAVRGTGGLRGGRISSHGDHRLAMVGALAGLASRDGVEVEGMDAAGVSYPGFDRETSWRLGSIGRRSSDGPCRATARAGAGCVRPRLRARFATRSG